MPDLILSHARIYTMDVHAPFAEAVAVKSGRIVAVGTNAAVLNLANAETRIVNMEGRTILPGFHDAHCHVLNFGMTLSMVPLGTQNVKSIADVIQCLSDRAVQSDSSPTPWVIGRGYDQNSLSERRHPHRQDLDAVRPASHVLITHASGHAVSVNSRVLLQAGITKETPDPSGGTIVRDARGEPTGVLLENAIMLAYAVVPPATISQKIGAIRSAVQSLSAMGTTSACDAATEPADIPAYRRAVLDQPAVRLTLMPLLPQIMQTEGQILSRHDLLERGGSSRLQIGPAKLFIDGAISTRTALLRAAYADQPDTCGTSIWEPAELETRVLTAHQAGWQLAAHAIGDAAIDRCLDAFGKAQARHPRPDARHRVEHAMLLWRDQIGRINRLNVLPVFQPEFIPRFGDTYITALGRTRADRLMPFRAVRDVGLPLVFSSDLPIVAGEPLSGIAAALRRRTPHGEVLDHTQTVSAKEAFGAYTSGAAYSVFAEHHRGAVTAGLAADFVVFDNDPLQLPPDEWPEAVHVQATLVNGECVFGEL